MDDAILVNRFCEKRSKDRLLIPPAHNFLIETFIFVQVRTSNANPQKLNEEPSFFVSIVTAEALIHHRKLDQFDYL